MIAYGDSPALPDGKLHVPDEFKNYLLENERKLYVSFLVIFVLSLCYGYVLEHHWGNISLSLPLLLLSKWLAWKSTKDIRWNYEFSGYYTKLISMHGWSFQWQKLRPGVHVVSKIEHEHWRNYPMLGLTVRTKWPLSSQKVWLVYHEEDRQKLETQIIPLLRRYETAKTR